MPSHVDASLIKTRDLSMPISLYSFVLLASAIHSFSCTSLTSMMCSAFSTLRFSSNDIFASTSVDTLPGTIFRISFPNCTSRLSSVASTCSSTDPPCFFPYSHASSMSFAYSGFFEAARIKDGLVVASCGLYLPMVAKSPESQTTVCSKKETHQQRCSTVLETPTQLRK